MNPNNITSAYYNLVSSPLKTNAITDAEIGLINRLVTAPADILDIGAGTGRHALPLLELGFNITALDSSKDMLEVLKSSVLIERDQNLKVVNKSIYNFHATQKFNVITLFWNTFNEIALTKKDALKLLKILKSILKSDGFILLNIDNAELVDPESFNFTTQATKQELTYKMIWKTYKFNSKTNTSTSKEQIEVYKNDKLIDTKTTFIKQRYWSLKEVENLAQKAGLKVEKTEIKNSQELYLILTTSSK